MKINIMWFRRDLRVEDNRALQASLESGLPTVPLFIFDEDITDKLPPNDTRITFIYDELSKLDKTFRKVKGGLLIRKGRVEQVWKTLLQENKINAVYWNRDYEPYAVKRDKQIASFLKRNGVEVHTFKDQVIFEPNEILKKDGKPYTVYTPYKNNWLKKFMLAPDSFTAKTNMLNLYKFDSPFPKLEELGFKPSGIKVRPYQLDTVQNYGAERDFPALDSGSYLGPHLRFGTISIRQVVTSLSPEDEIFLSELVWREFFMQILAHFPRVIDENFKTKYNGLGWRNREDEFERWKQGKTGFPFIDAGMRQLNQTGYMHNRVRMITAGFLCKHLLIDWRWGEKYFAEKLLDYELSSNNGNWQWSAGTGCDAAPYFRIFNPNTQLKKFDPRMKYVHKWIPELDSAEYYEPMVDHKLARERCLAAYRLALK